jgi:hypothetical protein
MTRITRLILSLKGACYSHLFALFRFTKLIRLKINPVNPNLGLIPDGHLLSGVQHSATELNSSLVSVIQV